MSSGSCVCKSEEMKVRDGWELQTQDILKWFRMFRDLENKTNILIKSSFIDFIFNVIKSVLP